MKQMTCAQMGGPAACTFMITGSTAEEMSMNGMKHVEEAHPELAAQIKAMTKEETDKWMAEFSAKFDALADV